MEPLPPVKEVEYRCIVGKAFDELAGSEFITFAFETAKEFSSFRYEIAVRYRITMEPEKKLEFKVLGMTATRTMMPAFGTARSVLKIPMLPFGVYAVRLIKSDGTDNIFSIELTKKGIQILQPVPRKRFIDLIVENKAAATGAKILSTVSKTPPPPLVPRTIQKRQPTPPTPEELEILESLKTETPEERDAREEMELFGGRKKVDKKELEAVEKDLKKMGDTTGMIGTKKAGATRPLDEVKEVPADMKHSKAKVTPAPVAKPAEKAKPATKPAAFAKPVASKPKPAAPPAKAKAPAKATKPAAPAKLAAPVKPAAPAKHAAPAKKAAPKKPAVKPAAKAAKPVKKVAKKR